MSESIQRCNFSVGESIDGKYQVQKVLGEGTFGIVYSVIDGQGNPYALKLLRLWEVHPEIREGLVMRFDMEYETGRIESEYLVHSLDHGLVNGNPYIVMELCSGGDIITLAEHTRLNLPKIATHVLKGLDALHRCGKVHRDLKPENVLLKFPTTDIFSFGVMMYQLITNELPFGKLDDERDLVAYLKKGKNGDWSRSTLRHQVDGIQWERLIEGCLEPRFQDRLQSVKEVLQYVPEMPYEPPINMTVKEPDPAPFQTKIVNGVLLRVMQGDDYGRVYYLDNMLKGDKSILTVGRKDESADNDIPISEESSSYISRKHCTLELDYNIGSWIIRDGQWDRFTTGGWRKSTNGTFVNSTEVSRTGMVFNPGDIISIGDTKLRAEGY